MDYPLEVINLRKDYNNKDAVKDEHLIIRELLAEQGVHQLLPWDED